MSGKAINLVTVEIARRLEIARDRSQVPGSVFIGPLDDQDVDKATLILFLYKIAPNASLRNSDHTVVTNTPPPKVYRNAIPLDLYYLVTVGTKKGYSEETLLTSLGYVLQEFQVDPALSGTGMENQSSQISLEPLSTEELSRIWNLFPSANYRTSIAYLVSPVWVDPEDPFTPGEPIVDDRLKAGTLAPGGAL